MPPLFVTVSALLLALWRGISLWLTTGLPDLNESTSKISLNPANLPLNVTVATYLRVLRKSLPWPLGGCPPLRTNAQETGYSLPSIEIQAPLIVDDATLQRYLTAIDSVLPPSERPRAKEKADDVPPFLIAAVTSSLFILLASHALCPIAMMGAVNTDNSFEMLDPSILRSYEAFKQRRWLLVGKMEGDAMRKKRGCEWAMTVEMRDAESDKAVFRATWKALKFLSKSAKPRYDASKESTEQSKRVEVKDLPPTKMQLRPSSQSPRLFARSSGDWNPIHISSLAAKAFGLPSAIAHGNLMAAAMARTLEINDPSGTIHRRLSGEKPWKASMAFRAIMPVNKTFDVRRGDEDGRFIIARGDKVCVEGEVQAL